MEVFVREFDSRLLVALMAVEHGMDVIMGQKWLMERNIEAMPPGLWIFKTMTLRDSKHMKRAKAAGHLVASIDEEVPAMAEGSGDLLWVSQEAVETCDAIFCLGEEHASSLRRKWPHVSSKLILTGNPRWDYLRPELRQIYEIVANDYRKRFGRIILINTNSGETNSAKKKPEEVLSDYVKAGKINPNSKRDMDYWNDYMTFEQANLLAIPVLARQLSQEFPAHTIIVRPHPAENPVTYSRRLEDLPNVRVLIEGTAAPWIKSAEVLIHTYCTTGIEAFAMEKASICLATCRSDMQTTLLSGRLSITAEGVPATVEAVRELMTGNRNLEAVRIAQEQVFYRFFSGMKGPFASSNILESALNLTTRIAARDGFKTWRPSWRFWPWWFTTKNANRIFPRQTLMNIEQKISALSGHLKLQKRIKTKVVGDRIWKLSGS